jgi:hypothetical protein
MPVRTGLDSLTLTLPHASTEAHDRAGALTPWPTMVISDDLVDGTLPVPHPGPSVHGRAKGIPREQRSIDETASGGSHGPMSAS